MEIQCLSSSSSSSPTPQSKYDVFLSFRGEDTRKGFTDHLYAALKEDNGINTFRDDEGLERGESIGPKLSNAIEKSRFAVVVFSRNYADSTWCLNELARINECRKETRLIVFPVFYDVTPSDVRGQKGDFEKAFAKHEERFKKDIEKVERWRSALRQVADLSGWDLKNRYERKIIKKIVREILLLCKSPIVTEDLVGITSQLEKLKLYLKSNDVRVIGIWGMSGIGKTALAKVVYETYYNEFDGCSFIDNVKDCLNKRGLIEVKQRLLSGICNDKNIHIRNDWEVDQRIQTILRSKKVLLVLDDVNGIKKDQLERFVKWDWFGSDSRIVITSRDKHLLKEILKVDKIYECEKLNDQDALQLFCLKAFGKEQPEEDFKNLSMNIVRSAGGLPLALDSFGSLLFHREKSHWEAVLKRLQKHLEEPIFKKLKRSYDELSFESQKDLFIYIACFLNGKKEDLIKGTLDGLDVYLDAEMDVLKEKSLITILNGTVRVHDLLQQMGWEIVHKKSFNERIALKFREHIVDALKHDMGSVAIKIINQESPMKEEENCICNPEAFKKMSRLRFLNIREVHFPHDIGYLSDDLRILEWEGYPSKSLPSNFRPKDIYELQMCSSKIEKLWERAMEFNNLGFIDLCGSTNLTQTPDLSRTPNLKHLDLSNCTNLVEVHESIFVHESLICLDLAGCKSLKLERVQNKIKMKSLETLNLSGCSSVEKIPEFGEDMKSLQKLNLHGSTNLTQTPDLSLTPNLKHLDFSNCTNLVEVHESIFVHESLNCLDLAGCKSLKLERVQNEIKMKSLETLNLSGCSSVEKIPEFGEDMKSLQKLNLDLTAIKELPSSIEHLTCLASLFARNCRNLVRIPCNICDLRSLKVVKFSKCVKLEQLPKNLEKIVCWENLDVSETVTSIQTTSVEATANDELAANGDGTTGGLANEAAEDLIEERTKRSRTKPIGGVEVLDPEVNQLKKRWRCLNPG